MSFVDQYHLVRVQKRRRKAWYRRDPGTPEGREAYKIARKNEGQFVRAFLEALKTMWTPKAERDVKRAIRERSAVKVLEAVPVAQEAESEVWEKFRERIMRAYAQVMQEAGDDATERMNAKFKTRMRFGLETAEDRGGEETIEKAVSEGLRAADEEMMVPINPYSKKWMEERATHLIEEGLTWSQREVVTDVLSDGFSRGLRAEEIFGEIKANVGLTPRWSKAVQNRKEMLRAAGVDEDEVRRQGDAYREELLGKRAQMIARTETITAQAQGRNDAWKIAQDSGKLPEVRRRWLTAGPTGNPDNPCEICLELDGKTAKLGEPYESAYIGAVDMPGESAHPHCGCTETLERVE